MKSKKMEVLIKQIFFSLIGIFVLLMSYLFLMPNLRAFFPFFVVLAFIFFFLGGALIFLTLKNKIKVKLKFFLILTGSASSGILLFAILHNLFYALAIITEHMILLHSLMQFFHILFFLISIPLCPVCFLVGAIGGIILFYRK